MSWRDDLRRVRMPDGRMMIGASFRGVPFFVESGDRAGGRRTVTHEFPGRDEPFVEDLGRAATVLSVDGYVLGEDYVRDRDALLAALEASGPGELVHPHYGVMQAQAGQVTTRESQRDGGTAQFQITFRRTSPTPPAPIEAPDLGELVDEAATAALVATETELVESYDVAGQPSWATASLGAEFNAARLSLLAELEPIASTIQDAAQLNAQVRVMGAQAAALVRTPSDLLGSLSDVLTALVDTTQSAPRGVVLALLDVYDDIGQVLAPAATTATRVLELANKAALVASMRRWAVLEAARLAPQVAYETLEEAQADSATIAELLEDQAGAAGATAYPSLVQLRAQLQRAVPGDAVLARLVTAVRPVSIPSLLLAYQLYGSVDSEAAIVARNRASHPGFMAGALQVLSRDE